MDRHCYCIKCYRQFDIFHAGLIAGLHFLSLNGTGSIDDVYFIAAEFHEATTRAGNTDRYFDCIFLCGLEIFCYRFRDGIHGARTVNFYNRIGARNAGSAD